MLADEGNAIVGQRYWGRSDSHKQVVMMINVVDGSGISPFPPRQAKVDKTLSIEMSSKLREGYGFISDCVILSHLDTFSSLHPRNDMTYELLCIHCLGRYQIPPSAFYSMADH